MKRMLRGLLVLVLALLLIVLLGGAGAFYWVVVRPQPQIAGTVSVPGISDTVAITRDLWGVPHVTARTAADAVFGQGYVHAQDRLWQMEFNRRVAAGRLSEVLGKATVENDKYLRTLGFRSIAARELEQAEPATRDWLEAYARGVNAFIDSHRDNLPPEFTILGFQPEPWTPVDSVSWGKVMALSLGGNLSRELLRMDVIARVGAEKWNEIEAFYPAGGPFIVTDGYPTAAAGVHASAAGDVPAMPADALLDLARLADETRRLALGSSGDDDFVAGSNNWVIHGSRTTTGKPLLANDPHLGIQLPSIWYEVHLDGGGLRVSGVSFPGVPGVVIGHNERIAWGVTNTGPDVQDLYIEKPNPANPAQFEFGGAWEDARVTREVIKVKGEPSVEREVLVTRHGPIISGLTPAARVSQTLALRWTALEPNRVLDSVRKLNEAQNWEQFRAALRDWAVPAQNFVYADVDGNIGYQMPGWIPVRARGDGRLPVAGWTGADEWKGYIPFDELPRAYNPPRGYIVTANNAVTPPNYKHFISAEWAAPYRAQRIAELIEAKPKLSPEDMRAIQADEFSPPAADLAALIARAHAGDETARRAQAAVANWDFRYSEASAAPVVSELFMRRVISGTFADELGSAAELYVNARDVSLRVFLRLTENDPQSAWFDDVRTSDRRESLQDVLDRGLAETAADLRRLYGDDPVNWAWGKVHIANFTHPLGLVKPLDLLFNRQTPVGGGTFSVRVTSVTNSMGVSSISSFRQVINLSQLGASRIQNTVGASGVPLSAHFDDQLPYWRTVKPHPMLWTGVEVDANREGVLILKPQDRRGE